MNSHEPQLMSVVSVGQDLIDEQQFGAEKVQGRLEEIMNLWKNLKDLSDYRKRRLTEAVDYHQVRTIFRFSEMRTMFNILFLTSV